MNENLSQIIRPSIKSKKEYKDGKAKNIKVIRKYYGSAELKSIAERLTVLIDCFSEFSGQCIEELRKMRNLTDHIYDLNEKMDQLMIDTKLKRKVENGSLFDFNEDEEYDD